MNSPVIVPSQIWISFQKFLNVSFMLVYHHIWSHSHQSLPSNLHTNETALLRIQNDLLLAVNENKFQPWYFLICLPHLIRLIIKFSCPGWHLFIFIVSQAQHRIYLLRSSLLNRTISVPIHSHSTQPSSIFTGISQGSVLDLFFFSLHILQGQALSVKFVQSKGCNFISLICWWHANLHFIFTQPVSWQPLLALLHLRRSLWLAHFESSFSQPIKDWIFHNWQPSATK